MFREQRPSRSSHTIILLHGVSNMIIYVQYIHLLCSVCSVICLNFEADEGWPGPDSHHTTRVQSPVNKTIRTSKKTICHGSGRNSPSPTAEILETRARDIHLFFEQQACRRHNKQIAQTTSHESPPCRLSFAQEELTITRRYKYIVS